MSVLPVVSGYVGRRAECTELKLEEVPAASRDTLNLLTILSRFPFFQTEARSQRPEFS